MDAINAAIAAAQAEALNTPETTSAGQAQPLATVQPAGAVAVGGAPRSLADFMANTAMNVEAYLAVSELGIRFGKDKQLHDEIIVDMKLKDAKPGFTLRFNTPGAGVTYLTSWDGATEARSKQNWAACIAQAKQIDGNSYPSDLVELPVTLVGEGKRKEGGSLKEGTIVGLSLSYMNSKAFGAFLQNVVPLFGMDRAFRVKLTAVARKGAGQDYGVFGYEVLGAVDELEAAGAKGKKAA